MERPSTKESIERHKPTRLVTAKGSVYTYLPDGRTQRYKAATETLEAPQDLLVFMPPWNTIETKAKELYPEVFVIINKICTNNETRLFVQIHNFIL
jgi:hypothetical protein